MGQIFSQFAERYKKHVKNGELFLVKTLVVILTQTNFEKSPVLVLVHPKN